MIRNLLGFAACAVCCLVLLSGKADAQTVTGSLVGHVEDANGASVAGARVTVTDIERGTAREVVTNEEGNYSIGSVDPGAYRIEVQQTNFKRFIRERV
ncbi:MAG: carboxypeptidase-like regulatory domain-containing protein, partial [Acidobacteriota bacterium]